MIKPSVHLDIRYGIFLKLMPLSKSNIILFQLELITKHIIFHWRQVAMNTKEELLNQNLFLFVFSYLKPFHKFVVLIT